MNESDEQIDEFQSSGFESKNPRPKFGVRRRTTLAERSERRCAHDELLARAQHLSDGDRILAEKSFGEGLNAERLGKAFKVSPSIIRRRLRRIRRTLSDPCFLLVTHFGDCLPAAMRPVAHGYFVDGLSLRQCSTHFNMSLHHVRQTLAVIRSILILKDAPVNVHRREIDNTRAVQISVLNLDR